MSVCQSPFVKVQPVYWVSCPVFSHIIGWVPFLFLYYWSSLYVSSYIECVILFLLAQGCRNDIKKQSCLTSCDRSTPPSTGIANVSCRTKGNCDLFRAWSPNTGQVGVSCFTISDSRANGPPINAGCDRADGSLNCLPGFLDSVGLVCDYDQECSLSSSTRLCSIRCWELPRSYWTNFSPKKFFLCSLTTRRWPIK